MKNRHWSRHELDIPSLRRSGVLAVPPSAAQRLEQGRGIDKAPGLRLDERKQRRVISVLGGEQSQITDGAELQLPARNLEALERGALGCDRRSQGFGIGLHRVQRV